MQTLEISSDFVARDVAGAATLRSMRTGPGRPPIPLRQPPNRLREVRERKGLSLAAVKKLSGFSTQTLQKWETGERPIPLWKIEKIARALGVPAYTLLKDYDAASGEPERMILAIFRRLSTSERQRAIALLAALEAHDEKARASGQ